MTAVGNYAWLLLGGLAQVFGFGKWATPLAGWLAPVFLPHFGRSTVPMVGVLGIWLALFLAMSLSNRGVMPVLGPWYLVRW
jgi:hypothetical protein